MASDVANGILRIKNVTGSDYVVAELNGHILADQAELDLLDTALPLFYSVFRDAERSAFECPNAQLTKDIVSGAILVTLRQPPRQRRG